MILENLLCGLGGLARHGAACGNASHQWKPPSSQISKMIGIGIPISQSNIARPMEGLLEIVPANNSVVASRFHVTRASSSEILRDSHI
jgi:hypothetical protein